LHSRKAGGHPHALASITDLLEATERRSEVGGNEFWPTVPERSWRAPRRRGESFVETTCAPVDGVGWAMSRPSCCRRPGHHAQHRPEDLSWAMVWPLSTIAERRGARFETSPGWGEASGSVNARRPGGSIPVDALGDCSPTHRVRSWPGAPIPLSGSKALCPTGRWRMDSLSAHHPTM